MNGNADVVPGWLKRLVPALIVLLMALFLLVPPGENKGSDYDGYWDEERQEWVEVHNERVFGTTTGRILGQLTFQFLVISLLFAYKRPLGDRIGHRLRTRFHRGLGLTILTLAIAHAAVLIPNQVFRGWFTGTISFAVLALHGLLGFAKPWFLRRWGTDVWRYVHLATAWTGLLIGLQHTLFYGQHYGLLREVVFGAGR